MKLDVMSGDVHRISVRSNGTGLSHYCLLITITISMFCRSAK